MSRSLPEACHTTVARKFQIFNLGTSSPTRLGVFPIPAFPPYAMMTPHFMEAPTMGSITQLRLHNY